jgi:hypothetical protein
VNTGAVDPAYNPLVMGGQPNRGLRAWRRTLCVALVLASCGSAPHALTAAESPALQGSDSRAACPAIHPEGSARPMRPGDPGDFATPPDPNGPTLVDLGLFIIDVSQIHEIDNTFHAQGFMELVWCDPRLAFDPAEAGVREEEYLERAAAERLERIWWPDPDFENQVAPRRVENQVLIVRADGTVAYRELFVVDLKSPFDLRRFPFDRQSLLITIESFAWPASVLEFSVETDEIGFSDRLRIPEWRVESVTPSVAPRREVRDRAEFSEFTLDIEVAREWGFYVWRLMLPLVLMVFITWIVFWLTGPSVKGRLGIAFRGLLIVIAYQFVISGSLPRLPYLTFMDSFLTLSFVLMVLTILQSLLVTRYAQSEQEAAVERLDDASRWLFPIAYLAGIAALAVGHGLLSA